MPKRWLRQLLKKGDTGEAEGKGGKRKSIFRRFSRKSAPVRNSEPNVRDVVRQMEAERKQSMRLSDSYCSNRSPIRSIQSDDDLAAAYERDVKPDTSSKKNEIPFDEDDDDSLDPLNEFVSTSFKPPEDSNSDDDSLDGNEVFDLDSTVPKPKRQFLEAAMMAKSASDLGYVHATELSNASKWKSKTDLKYEDDNESVGDNELFENDESAPAKNKFLDAAYTTKSISDLSFIFSASNAQLDHNDSSASLDDVEVLKPGSPVVRTKKQFLDAAMIARSMTDLNYVHSTQNSLPRRKSTTDLIFADDQSLGDKEAFEVEAFEPRPKKQFLEAALAAKSISNLNFVYTAKEAPINNDSHRSHDSLGSPEGFALGSPIVRPKKQFLDAAMMAKSLSDINYIHADLAKIPRRKSLPDLKYPDEESLGENEELFENEEEPPTKNQFLDAALAAKSISDLNFVFSAAQQQQERASGDADDHNHDGSLYGSIELFALDGSNANPRRKKAFMAKSMSDFNYVHSVPAPRSSRRKSLTDLTYGDDRSLGDNELFDLDDTQIVRPKKQFLEAALMAKSISDLKIMYLHKSTYSSSMGSESRDDTSNVVPEHLLGLSQPHLFHSSDLHSIDNEDLFESKTEEEDPPERPLVKAALEAKAQQVEGIIVVSSRDEPSVMSTDHSSEVVPEHLVIVNQPAKAHAHDNYSIEVEDIFEHSSGELRPSKPLLKAALEAQAQLEGAEVAEMFANKSMSHLGSERYFGASPSSVHELSQSIPDFSAPVNVPDHLAVVHQPKRALPTLDEMSIDGDRLFDSPAPKKSSLLEAALRAKRASNENLLQLETP